MTDYTLKFPDEPSATAALFTDGTPNYPNTDVIGTITRADGTVSAGWHVNVRTEAEAPELEAYRVFPAAPVRVWA